MKNQIRALAVALCLCATLAQAVPPYFKWERSNCWLDVGFQMVCGMPKLVRFLADPRNEQEMIEKIRRRPQESEEWCKKENRSFTAEDKQRIVKEGEQEIAFIAALADLVRKIQAEPEKQHSLDRLHQLVDPNAYVKSSPEDPMKLFDHIFSPSVLSRAIGDKLRLRTERSDLFTFHTYFDSGSPLEEQLRGEKITHLGPYLILVYNHLGKSPVQVPPVPLKVAFDNHEFELILVDVVRGESHHWAYIKDQHEKEPSWYKSNDISHAPRKADPKEINDEWKTKGVLPRFLIYKLVESPLVIGLKNFSDSLDALRRQLVSKK
jgi:hypothetical protein